MKTSDFLKKNYAYFHFLSLDVVIGTCAGMYFFDKLLNTQLGIPIYFLLGLAVWFIYTLEHLLDAKKISNKANTRRHAFHQRNFRILAFFLFVVGIAGLWIGLSIFRDITILIYAAGLGSIILISLLLLKYVSGKWIVLKEFSTALFYVAGIMFAPFFFYEGTSYPNTFWLLGLGYFMVAWFNTLLFGLMDKNSDQIDGLASSVFVLGVKRLRAVLFWLMILMLAYISFLYFILHSFSYLHISILFLIGLFHGIAFLQMDKKKENIRTQLDASFMLPFLMVLV